MTASEFGAYLLFVAILAGVIGIANLLRPHKRWLGVGAILLGIAAMLYRQGASTTVVSVACLLAAASMIRDMSGRAGRKA